MVVAPFSLPGNYTFDAIIDGRSVRVMVPPGGCAEGDVIEIPPEQMVEPSSSRVQPSSSKSKSKLSKHPFPSSSSVSSESAAMGAMDEESWDHGLFSCFSACCTSLFWMSLFSPYIVLGQLMQRIKLNVCGVSDHGSTNKITCVSVTLFVLFVQLAIPSTLIYLYNTTQNDEFYYLAAAFIAYSFIILIYWNTILRTEYRTSFHIPPSWTCCSAEEDSKCAGCCEDFCISLWCHCCSYIQMGQQFSSNRRKPSHKAYYCCSTTGLARDAHAIV